MLSVVFWNTQSKSVSCLIGELAATHRANVFVLLELAVPPTELLTRLAEATGRTWAITWTACARVTIVTSFPERFIKPVAEGPRFRVANISLPGLPEIILAAAHLPSQLHQSQESQLLGVRPFVDAIESSESAAGHRRTVVVGDFNMDPYDAGMVGAGAMHGMMLRTTARRETRIVSDVSYRMFYNPMWSMVGERSKGPPGTYRYWNAEHVCREWHVFDQVLVRPELSAALRPDAIHICDAAGSHSLLTKTGLPTPSDHLPVAFVLSEPGAHHV